jgi:Ca2+-binding RTX toxin-like protein
MIAHAPPHRTNPQPPRRRAVATGVIRIPIRAQLPLTLAVLVLSGGTAAAATVSSTTTVYEETRDPAVTSIDVTAARGEVNHMTVTSGGDGRIIRDEGALLTVSGDCRLLDAHTATCATVDGYATGGVSVSLGDGDDTLSVTAASAESVDVDAGPGNDVVAAAGRVDGGPGDDRLTALDGDGDLAPRGRYDGGPGNDVVVGGRGSDELVDRDDDGVDRLDGGPLGRNQLDVHTRRQPLSIDLARGTVTAGGSVETITNVDDIAGGRGPDQLTGDDGVNIISGGPGDDQLVDGGGRDQLDGGLGADRVTASDPGDIARGSSGDDSLIGGDGVALAGDDGDDRLSLTGRPAHARCGPGADTVAAAPLDAEVPADCERIQVGTGADLTVVAAPSRLHGGRLAFVARCDSYTLVSAVTASPCRGAVDIRLLVRGRAPLLLGRGGFNARRRASTPIVIAIGPAGRRALRTITHPTFGVRITQYGGTLPTAAWTTITP